MNAHVSVSRTYRIRRLLRQYQTQLKSVVAAGAGLTAEPDGDLDAVLESLYLDPDEVAIKAKQLEILTCRHQLLSQQDSIDLEQLQQIVSEIFWILGLKLIAPLAGGTPFESKVSPYSPTQQPSKLSAALL